MGRCISVGHAVIANVTQVLRMGSHLRLISHYEAQDHSTQTYTLINTESVGVWQDKTGYGEKDTITHSYSLDISREKQRQHTPQY